MVRFYEQLCFPFFYSINKNMDINLWQMIINPWENIKLFRDLFAPILNLSCSQG